MTKKNYKNNCIAAANGYNGGLTVEWMASQANVSKSAMYNHIKRGNYFLLELHPQYKRF